MGIKCFRCRQDKVSHGHIRRVANHDVVWCVVQFFLVGFHILSNQRRKTKTKKQLIFSPKIFPCPDSQRKGLEKRFQLQKYISKPDRKKLAERLGLKDSQVMHTLLTAHFNFNGKVNLNYKTKAVEIKMHRNPFSECVPPFLYLFT